MLEGIHINNFKAARNLDLPLSSLTFLAGLNGSGKSTVLQALAAIRQTYQAGEPSGLQLSGPLVLLGKGIDVLSEGAAEDTIGIEIVEDGATHKWACKVPTDASQLEFLDSPLAPPHFASKAHFQYLQA